MNAAPRGKCINNLLPASPSLTLNHYSRNKQWTRHKAESGIDNSHMRVICSSLEKVTRLQSLSFDNNNIGDNGGDRLALALAANKRVQLHTLTLTRNVLGR